MRYVFLNPQSAIRNPQSAIRNPQSAIRNPQSAIRNTQALCLLIFKKVPMVLLLIKVFFHQAGEVIHQFFDL
jgi:major type 1 subunit fimbrin (pilin)